jgi:hypothetical protein
MLVFCAILHLAFNEVYLLSNQKSEYLRSYDPSFNYAHRALRLYLCAC